jgi:hypothetical protein
MKRHAHIGPVPSQLRSQFRFSAIRSVQAGQITGTGTAQTATITAVDMSNSIVVFGGFSRTVTTFGNEYQPTFLRLVLTNATTLTATRDTADNTMFMSFTVVEFWPGVLRSVQRGTITVGAALNNTATILAVTPGKSAVQNLGWSTNGDSALENINLTLTNATTVTAAKQAASGSNIVSYEVWEWF